MPSPNPMLSHTNIQLNVDDARAIMKPLWQLKLDGHTSDAGQAAAMFSLSQIVDGYLLMGGDVMDITAAFDIKSDSARAALKDASTQKIHWQRYAEIMGENPNRSEEQKRAMWHIASIYASLTSALTHRAAHEEKWAF